MAAVALFMVGRLAKFNDIFTSTVPTINNFSNHALRINCLTLFVQLKIQNNILFLYTTQYFCGESHFQWRLPCEPSELVHFRNRIGERGAEKILEVSIKLHSEKIGKEEVVADTTVQEKNITFPTDTKLRRKIIERCWKMADAHAVKYSHSYKRKAPELLKVLRSRSNRLVKQRNKARLKLKTYAGRLLRELQRKLTESDRAIHAGELGLMKRVLEQKQHDKNKIYSLHEPQVECIAKGKAHKKYEFGAKASIMMTANSMVIVGAKSFVNNPYDGDTLTAGLDQVERLMGKRPTSGVVDRGYRGRTQAEKTKITIPAKRTAIMNGTNRKNASPDERPSNR